MRCLSEISTENVSRSGSHRHVISSRSILLFSSVAFLNASRNCSVICRLGICISMFKSPSLVLSGAGWMGSQVTWPPLFV